MSYRERYYVGKGPEQQKLAVKIEEVFRIKGYQVQSLPAGGNVLIVQIRKEGALRTVTGMAESTSVYLEPIGQDMRVRLGEAKWIDKAGAGAVGMLLLWPLAFTAGFGAYRQSQLGKEIWTLIDSHLGLESISTDKFTAQAAFAQTAPAGAATNVPEAPVQSGLACPTCDAFVADDAKFCTACGAKVHEFCAGCQTEIAAGMKFCPGCGTAVTTA